MKKISLNSLNFRLDRNDMKMIFGRREAAISVEKCQPCSSNSECASGVCASNVPGCGAGRFCL